MGLLKAGFGAVGGVLADQWKEFFYCESIDVNVLAVKGKKRESKRSSNTKGEDNIISSGSVVAVADGQAMIIVEQGKIVEFCAEPGEFTYDESTEPSIFNGPLDWEIENTFANIGKRFEFGGQPAKDQRVYYFNLKEIVGNKYGTPNPVPFRVVDKNIGLDVDIAIRCNGEYSYKLVDPLLFYANVCGNVAHEYRRSEIDGMLNTELLTALQPAFAKISEMGIRYSSLPGHTALIADALNEVLSSKWAATRGLKIASFGINSVTASKEDEDLIKELQRTAVMRNPGMAGASLVSAQSDAMRAAASNPGGAMIGFAGLNAAAGAGGLNANTLFNMDAGQQAQNLPHVSAKEVWKCDCGAENLGRFCDECGKANPVDDVWQCECGARNKGKFCAECGKQRPSGNTWKCECGTINKGNFCNECGRQKTAGKV